jgi:hypothetical protein
MNMSDGLLVVFLAFLAGMGNRLAGEAIDYVKIKRHALKKVILNNGKVKEE